MDDWKKYLVPVADPITLPRTPRGIFLWGPEELGLRENTDYSGGPEEFVANNPQLFAIGTTSRDEGYFYWALLKVIGPEAITGRMGAIWFYQSKVGGGNNKPGGAVIDFLIEVPGRDLSIGVRIVTPQFHYLAGPFKAATDREQVVRLRRLGIEAVDVHSVNYLFDDSGEAVILSAQRAVEGLPDPSPLYSRVMGARQ